jgi:hypothetical protein
VKYPPKIGPQPRLFVSALVLVMMGVFQTVCPACHVSPGPSEKLQSAEPLKEKVTSLAKVPPALPLCPPPGHTPVQPSQLRTGHHRVILSWNASAPSPSQGSKAVGYCVYRRKERKKKTKNAATLKLPCGECEKVNSVPIVGTSCVDDVVENDATYYYAVTAINAKGMPSTPSNVATAVIPPETQISSVPVSSPPPPSCRGASNAK